MIAKSAKSGGSFGRVRCQGLRRRAVGQPFGRRRSGGMRVLRYGCGSKTSLLFVSAKTRTPRKPAGIWTDAVALTGVSTGRTTPSEGVATKSNSTTPSTIGVRWRNWGFVHPLDLVVPFAVTRIVGTGGKSTAPKLISSTV
jgi:hypothetical protein